LIDRGKRSATLTQTLLAFEIADEVAVRASLGSKLYDSYFLALLRSVDGVTEPGEPIATWNDRIVIVAQPANRPGSAPALVAQIQAAFSKLVETAAEHGDAPTPKLTCAILPFSAFVERPSSEALDQVLAELVAVRPFQLPMPLTLRASAESRPTADSRCSALRDALERALAYFVAAMLAGALREGEGPVAAVVSDFGNRELSLPDWTQLARRLAPLVARHHFLWQSARVWSDSDEHLTRTLDDAVVASRDAEHRASHDPEAYIEQERVLRLAIDSLVQVLAPLARRSLVAVARIVEELDDDLTVYELWELHGTARTYTRRRLTLQWRLRKDWCYVLDGTNRPLLLAPLFFTKICDDCKELELAWTRRIQLVGRGRSIDGCGLTTEHLLSATMPTDRALELLVQKIKPA
jgi:hypothetical protein